MKTPTDNIAALFLAAAAKYPDHIAIIERGKEISYAQLEKEVKATAAYFHQRSIGKGDRVLVFVPMGIDLYRVVLALFYIGASAVFLDEWVSKQRLERCCQLADCKGFIGVFKARVFAWFSKELRRIPVMLSLSKQSQTPLPLAEVSPDSAALLTFTTGSTGPPKAAKRSHAFLRQQFDALLEEIQPQASDIDMPVLPIVLFVNLGVGCTSVIANFKMSKPEAMKPALLAQQIRRHQINRITASPFFVDRLTEHLLEQKESLQGIEKIFTGGAPVFPQKAERYAQAFPNAKSTIVYGSTEAEPISSIDALELAQQSGSLDQGLPVGKIFHRAEVKIIQLIEGNIQAAHPEDLTALQVADEQVGEIIVTGPHVLKQYFRNEEAFHRNKIQLENTIWHRTGDSGFIKEGQLFLTGRCQQLIQQGEQILSPFIIENKCQSIAGVWGGTLLQIKEQVVLAIQSHLPLHQLELLFADIPFDKICTVAQLPMDPRHHSKIDYGQLKKMISRD